MEEHSRWYASGTYELHHKMKMDFTHHKDAIADSNENMVKNICDTSDQLRKNFKPTPKMTTYFDTHRQKNKSTLGDLKLERIYGQWKIYQTGVDEFCNTVKKSKEEGKPMYWDTAHDKVERAYEQLAKNFDDLTEIEFKK